MLEPGFVKQFQGIHATFVQTAEVVKHANGRITLQGISPATLYVSDHPECIIGHLDTAVFVDLWSDGEDAFSREPPRAVIAFVGKGRSVPEDVAIEIRDPILRGGALGYAATVLEGVMPARAGGCTLFIDPFARPVSPASVAALHRLARRRTQRRSGVAAR